jgi:hypothetical protein
MLNEKGKENKNKIIMQKIYSINNFKESITKYYNLTNGSLDNIDNIITTIENELNTSEKIPSNILEEVKEFFNLVRSNIKDNKNYINKFFNSIKRNSALINEKPKSFINEILNHKNSKKQTPQKNKLIKYTDKNFVNKINYTKIMSKINNDSNSDRKANTAPKKRSLAKYNIVNNNTNRYCPTENYKNTSHIAYKSNQMGINKKLYIDLNIKKKDIEILTKEKDHLKKEIEKLRKEIENKAKEIKSLKSNLNNKDDQGKKILIESIKSIFEKDSISNNDKPWNNSDSFNRILDNYKKENELLKKDKAVFSETINHLKNELIKDAQTNLEIKLNNKIEMENVKNDYNKKISEIKDKATIIKNLYDAANEEKEKLKVNIAAKELAIINLQIEVETIRNSNNLLADNNESNLKAQIIELNKKIEEQNKIINETNEKYGNAIIENAQLQRYKENPELINEDLKSKNKNLEKENEDLKENVETLKNIVNENINKNNVNGGIEEIIEYYKEKELLKKNNEELKVKYHDLECKYNQLLKNDNNILNCNENNIIKNLEKENEKLKNINSSLVSWLEIKGLKKSYLDNKTEVEKLTVYDEEYDLPLMALGAKKLNNSLNLNIDNPALQAMKEKYNELKKKYIDLEEKYNDLKNKYKK